jgi:hypothetical protein
MAKRGKVVLSDNPGAGDLVWRKTSYSNGDGECVEVAPMNGRIAIRDSKNPSGPLLNYSAAEWRSFLNTAKIGNFDILR